MEILSNLLLPFTQPMLLFFLGIGTFAGIYIGAIPGLSVTMAVSLLISFTFSWDPLPAIALMIGINVGGVYGGSRSAILLNIPGAPAAVATTFDGYPLAQKGEAGKAIGVTVVQSFVGGLVGTVFLGLFAPVVAEFALKFAPRDYMLLAIMGLMLVGSLGCESAARGIFAAAVGVFLGMIGIDMVTGQPRFTFGNVYLMGGVSYIVAMIGLFGMSEALFQLRDLSVYPVKQKVDKIIPGWKNVFKYLPLSLRTSLMGVLVGALPGTGGDLAALLAYDHARRTVKHPSAPFGKGAIEGLVAPESANNAAIGGAYIPMLTLGIPGDAVTAIIIGALYIHGMKPGPLFMTERPDIFWLMVGGMLIANVFLLIFGFTGIRLFAKIVEVPKQVLMPVIMILSVVGAYSINNNIMDVYWMLGFGVIGYLFKLYKLPLGPVVLGVILSSLLEQNYRRAVSMAGNSISGFLIDVITHPISLVLLAVILVMIVGQFSSFRKLAKKED
ncbi:MAG: tripartite tricarboxylate transporter permease [Clostridium sp.]|nr:tripartite tricarboxylate transporter permease [Clostridium sp.]